MNHEQYLRHRQSIANGNCTDKISELVQCFYEMKFKDELEQSARTRIVGNLLRLNAGLPSKTSIKNTLRVMDILFERSKHGV